MTADVVPFRSSSPEDRVSLHPARANALIHEANQGTAALLSPYYKDVAGLIDRISVIDSRLRGLAPVARQALEQWRRHGDLTEHKPFLSPVKLWVCLLFLIAGEVVMARTFAAGLQLPDFEAWFVALTVVGLMTALTAAIAHGAKRVYDDHRQGEGVGWGPVLATLFGVVAMAAVLVGQWYARSGYYHFLAVELDSPQAGSDLINIGLTAFQIAIALGLTAVFWFQGGNHRSEQARLQYRKTRRRIEALLRQRGTLSSDLTRRYNTLEAEWNGIVFKYQRAIAEWAAELSLNGVPLPEFCVTHEDFAALPPRVLASAEPVPAEILAVLEMAPQAREPDGAPQAWADGTATPSRAD